MNTNVLHFPETEAARARLRGDSEFTVAYLEACEHKNRALAALEAGDLGGADSAIRQACNAAIRMREETSESGYLFVAMIGLVAHINDIRMRHVAAIGRLKEQAAE